MPLESISSGNVFDVYPQRTSANYKEDLTELGENPGLSWHKV